MSCFDIATERPMKKFPSDVRVLASPACTINKIFCYNFYLDNSYFPSQTWNFMHLKFYVLTKYINLDDYLKLTLKKILMQAFKSFKFIWFYDDSNSIQIRTQNRVSLELRCWILIAILPPFQNIIYFNFSRFIDFNIHLNIHI
jgi:hypothetical protein